MPDHLQCHGRGDEDSWTAAEPCISRPWIGEGSEIAWHVITDMKKTDGQKYAGLGISGRSLFQYALFTTTFLKDCNMQMNQPSEYSSVLQ
ncbi:MAG: hypothetical protein ACLR23_23370 [Clostridia bacterium]